MDSKLSLSIDLNEYLKDTVVDKPKILFTNDAFLKMRALVTEMNDEIAWHGTVTKIHPNTYVIEDILVYPQTVTEVTVTTDQTEYSMWLMNQPDGIFEKIRFQGHSHVNMGTTPSGTDTAWYEAILQQLKEEDYYIFLITNKRAEMNIWIHDMKQNVIFEKDDITIGVLLEDNTILKDWTKEVLKNNIRTYEPPKAKVITQPYDRRFNEEPYWQYNRYKDDMHMPKNKNKGGWKR